MENNDLAGNSFTLNSTAFYCSFWLFLHFYKWFTPHPARRFSENYSFWLVHWHFGPNCCVIPFKLSLKAFVPVLWCQFRIINPSYEFWFQEVRRSCLFCCVWIALTRHRDSKQLCKFNSTNVLFQFQRRWRNKYLGLLLGANKSEMRSAPFLASNETNLRRRYGCGNISSCNIRFTLNCGRPSSFLSASGFPRCVFHPISTARSSGRWFFLQAKRRSSFFGVFLRPQLIARTPKWLIDDPDRARRQICWSCEEINSVLSPLSFVARGFAQISA